MSRLCHGTPPWNATTQAPEYAGLASLWLLKPVVGASNNACAIILSGADTDRVQARARIRRTKRDQITITDVPGSIDYPLLKTLISGECGIFPAALLSNLLSHILFERLHRHDQRRHHIHRPVIARILYVVEKFGACGRKRDTQDQHVRSANFLDQLDRLSVFASVVAFLADHQKNTTVFLGLTLQQIDRRTDCIQDRRAAVAWLKVFKSIVQFIAGVSVVVNQMGFRIEAHQSGLTALIGQKKIQQRSEFGHLTKLKCTYSSKFDGNDQRHRSRVHLFLDVNLLQHTVIFDNEIRWLQAVG